MRKPIPISKQIPQNDKGMRLTRVIRLRLKKTMLTTVKLNKPNLFLSGDWKLLQKKNDKAVLKKNPIEMLEL